MRRGCKVDSAMGVPCELLVCLGLSEKPTFVSLEHGKC